MRTPGWHFLRSKSVSKLVVFILLAVVAMLVWIKPRLADTASRSRSSGPIQVRQSGISALVTYDGPADSGDGLITARYVANLLGHFGIKPEIVNMSNYSSGQCERFGVTFVCGMTAETSVPQLLLQDVAQSVRPVCWINRHIKQLLSLEGQSARLGFTFTDYLDDSEFPGITYSGFNLPKSDGEINLIRVTDPSRARYWLPRIPTTGMLLM
jgi:hypothetical protein